MLRIKLVKSPIGHNWRNRATVQALGLRKMHHTVELPDNASIRGMVHKVQHMVEVEVLGGGAPLVDAKAHPGGTPKGSKSSHQATPNVQKRDTE
jgi:large subunit ribosomal protein L30